jgi:PD-(D/E)XK nuclease superfamily
MAPIIIRNSERNTLKRCPQRWWWAWRQGLRPIGEISDALWFGTGVHLALAEWYCGPGLKRGRHPAETFDEWSAGEIRYIKTSERRGNGAELLIEEKLVPARELGLTLLDEYLKKWGSDDSWHILRPEQTFQVDIPDPRNPGQAMAILAGTYDLVYRDLRTDKIWLGEHKTAKAVVTDHLPLDDQAGTYWAIADQHLRHAKLISKADRLQGINYNFLRKAMPDPRPRTPEGHYTNKPRLSHYVAALTGVDGWKEAALWKKKIADLELIAAANFIEVLGDVSKQQPHPLFVRHEVKRTTRERQQQIQRIQAELLHAEAYRSGSLPLLKRTTRDCQWDCPFYNMCLLHEGGSDWQEYRDAMYKVQDPYADHRKSTEE